MPFKAINKVYRAYTTIIVVSQPFNLSSRVTWRGELNDLVRYTRSHIATETSCGIAMHLIIQCNVPRFDIKNDAHGPHGDHPLIIEQNVRRIRNYLYYWIVEFMGQSCIEHKKVTSSMTLWDSEI